MKKLSVLFVLSLVLLSIFSFAGCELRFLTTAGEMSQLVGTYKLTKYEKENETTRENEDLLTLNEIVAYLIINENGTGFYLYEDKDTPFSYESVIVNFTTDFSDENLISAIEYSTGKKSTELSQKEPGCGNEPVMGYNSTSNTLSWIIPKITITINDEQITNCPVTVEYTKVDDDTTLGYVATELNKTFTTLPKYEFKNITSPLIYTNSDENSPLYNVYDYLIVDINSLINPSTATIYYRLKGTSTDVVQENVDLHIIFPDLSKTGASNVQLTILDQTYNLPISASGKVPANYVYFTAISEPDEDGVTHELYTDIFASYTGTQTTINGIITEITNS